MGEETNPNCNPTQSLGSRGDPPSKLLFTQKIKNKMTKQELLASLTFQEAKGNDVQSPGTFKEIFEGYDVLPLKHSKNGAARSSILVRKDNKVTTIVCSPAVTELFRANQLTINQIMGFPILVGSNGGVYVTLPSTGWSAVEDIAVKDFQVVPVSVSELEALA